MADVTSNIDQVEADLDALAGCFDLQSGLGADLLDTVAEGISDRSLGEQKAPDGSGWPENAEWAQHRADKVGKPIGVLSGEMLSMEQLRGEREITPTSATMTYGTAGNDFARRKAEWFTNGSDGGGPGEKSGATGQPERPFYELDDEISAKVAAAEAEHLERYVAGLGG